MQQKDQGRTRSTPRKRRRKPWDPIDLIEGLESRVLLTGAHEQALLTAIDSALTSPTGLTAVNTELQGSGALGTNVAVIGGGMSAYNPGTALASLLSRLGSTQYTSIPTLVSALQNGTGVTVLSTSDLLDNIELNVQFTTTSNASVPLNANYGVVLLDPQTLTMPTTLTENLTLGAYWDPTISPSGAAVFYVDADASTIQVSSSVASIGPAPVIPVATAGQQITISGAQAGNYVLAIQAAGGQPTSVLLDGAPLKTTFAYPNYNTPVESLTAGTHTIAITPAAGGAITSANLVPQSGAQLGFLQTSGGVTAVNFSPTFNFVLNDQPPVDSAETAGRLTLAQLMDTPLANLVSTQVTQSAPATVTASLSTPLAPGADPIVFTWSNVLAPSSVTSTLTTDSTLRELNELQAVNPTTLALGLDEATGDLDAAATTTMLSSPNPFDTTLPLLGESLDQLMDFTETTGSGGTGSILQQALTNYTNPVMVGTGNAIDPFSSDQQLISLIDGAGHNTITESANGTQLLFDLNMSIPFSSAATPFAGIGSASSQLNLTIPSAIDPNFTVSGTVAVQMTFGEDTSTGNFFVTAGSMPNVTVNMTATAALNTYDTNETPAAEVPIDFGGLGVDATGPLNVTPQATITLIDPQTDNPPTPGIITANELVSGTQPSGMYLPVPATMAISGTATADLSISVDGSNNLGIAPASLTISWPNLSNPTSDTVNTAALASYLAWNDVTPANMSNGLSELKSVLNDLPSGSALGQVAGLFDTSLGGSVNLVPPLQPAPAIPNFQSPTVASGTYIANPPPSQSSWGFYNGVAGVSASNSPLTTGTSNQPSGQVGFIQGGAQITSIIPNWVAGTYTLTVPAAQSAGNSIPEDFEVLLNNTVVGTIDPANTTYANYPITFPVPSGGSNSITFQGVGSGPNTALIGASSIVDVSSNPAFTSVQSMYSFFVQALGASRVTLSNSSGTPTFALSIPQTYTGNLAWSVEHPVESEADFSASGSVPATVSYLATIPLEITLSSTASAADPFYIGGGTDFTGSVNVSQSSLSGSAHLGNLSLTYANASMSVGDTFSLPLGTSGQQISMETLLSHPQSYFGKLAFSAGASLAFPITGGLPSPGSGPRVNFNWSNLGQPSSVTETDSNLGNISSATSYNDQGFIGGVTALNTQMGTWQSSPQMNLHLPWIDQTFEGVIPYIADFQSVFTQIESLNPSSASALDNDIRNTLSLPAGATITATAADAPANNDFEYSLGLTITNQVINFPFAAGAGFDSLFSINAQVHVTASFSGTLTFGFNPEYGFYVDGYSGSGNPQMSMTVNIGGTNGQNIAAESAGKFGNLPTGVGTASNPAVILLNASSAVNLTATGDNGLMISTTDLAQDGPALIQPTVSGTGSITLPFGMQLGATASTYQANAGPGLISIFYANWNPTWAQPLQFYNPATGSDDPTTVNSQSPTNPTNAANGFGSFYFDTGEFLTDMIGPYLQDIEQFNPIPPQLLSALNYNVPIINMTPLELLENYLGGSDDSGGGGDLSEGDGIETLMQIVTLISDLPTSTQQLDLSAYIPGAPVTGDAGMVDGGLDDDLSGFQDTLTTLGDYGITMPVFSDPHSAIAQTLLNQPTTLIEFKPGNNGYISYTASYNTDPITFPVFDLGILSANATFSAGISATLFANIDIGLTTRGLLGQGIGSGGTETGTPNLMDGFFIGDNTFGGDGTPYQAGLEFEGYVTIGGSLALGGVVSIASINGSLGPEGTLGVIVNDLTYTQTPQGPIPIGIANYNGNPAGDGKAYLDELSYIASNYGPLCAVMPVASLGLNLTISATVGDPPLGFSFTVYSHDFVIANWNVPCTPVVATLATVSGNTLTINPNINSEVLSTSDGPNNISAGVWYNTTTGLAQGIVVTESNQDQIFSQDIPFSQLTGVTNLVVNGTEGSDTFNIDPNLTEPNFNPANQQSSSTIQIQYFKINTLNGNDTADLSSYTTQNSNLLGLTIIGGTGTDHFAGNYCSDLIELGSGQNFAYVGTGNGDVIEGAGDDAITGGNGNDTVVGGDGEASIALGDGNNIINQGTGQAQIRVGNGQNLITTSTTVYNSGIAANGSALTSGNPPAPSGNQVAFIQGNSAISQTTTGWVASSNGNSYQYEIALAAAQRASGNNGGEDFEVFIDDNPVGIIDPTSTTYQTYTTSTFTVTSGPHLITLKGLDTAGGNNMVFVDSVNLIETNSIPTNQIVPPSGGGPVDGGFEATTLASGTYYGNDIAPPSNYLSGVANFSDAIPIGEWTYIAGIGTDAIDVGNGQNTIYGDPGGSTIKTGVGQDIIYAGGAGTDSITCGGGNDFVGINLDNEPTLQVPAVQSTPISPTINVNGGSGRTVLDLQGNGQITLKNGSVIFGPTANPTSQVQFSNISSLSLSGEGGAVSFDVSQWIGTPVQINGGGGAATIISSDDTNFSLNNSSLARSDGTSFALNGVTVADLTGGASNNTFTVTGWTGTGVLNGNGGNDTLVASGLANASLSNTQFQGGGNLQLLNIGQADLTAAAGGNANINASAFTGNTALFGQANNNTLIGGSGSDYIVGGPGMNNKLVGNGATANELVGGLGSSDIINGGAGQNTLVSSNGGGDTITTGSGASHVYTPGNNNTIHAEGGNAVLYVSSSGDTVDTGTSTTDQILHPGQLGTVASDFVAPTTSDLWVFPPNPVAPAATLPTGSTTLGQWVQFGVSASGGGVSSSPGAAIDPSIVAAGTGASAVQYAAWADNRDGNYQIYVASDSASGWAQLDGSAQGGGISNGNTDSLSPGIALDSAGSPVVAWTASGNIYVAEFNPAGNGGLGAWIALGGSLSGGGISNTGHASNPQIINTASGPVVAWLDTSSGTANVFVRELNGSSWVTVGAGSASGKGVTGSSTTVPGFSLATDGSNLALAWTQAGTSPGSSIYVLEDTGSGWNSLSGSSSGTGISGTYAAEEPSVAFTGGALYAAWAANTDGTNNIVTATDGGSGWQTLTIQTPISAGVNQVSRGAASDPVLSAEGSSLDLVWIEDRLPNSPDQAVAIYANRLSGGAFVAQLPGDSSFDGILGRSTSLSSPVTLSMAVDGVGHPFVSWGDSSSGTSQVYMLGDTLNVTKIIYVNDATGPDDSYTTAPGKSSGNSGLAPNSPLASINAALALATAPGDVILIDSGSYSGFSVGSSSNGVVILGSPSGSTEITGSVTISGGQNVDLQSLNFAGGLTISGSSGLELDDDVSSNSAVTISGSSNVSLNNDNLFGVNLNGSAWSAVSLINNDLTGGGLDINGSGGGLFVGGNQISLVDIAAPSQGLITGNNIRGGAYGGGLDIGASFGGGIYGNFIHNAVVGVMYGAASALSGNEIFHNHTGIVVSQNSGGLGFLSGSTPNYIVDNGIGVKLLGTMQGQYIGGNDIGVTGSGILGGNSLALANQIESNTTGINFSGTVQDERIDDNGTSFDLQNGNVVSDNLIYDNGTNLETLGASNVEIVNNSFYSPSQNNIEVDGGSSDVEILDDILWTGGGYDIYVDNSSRTGFFSDYNDLYTTGSGQIVYYLVSFDDILDWQDDVALYDLHSIGTTVVNPTWAQPQFVNLGFGDLNVFPTVAGNRASSPTVGTGDPETDLALPPALYVNQLANASFENGTTGWTVNPGGTTQSGNPAAFDGSNYFYSGSVAAGFAYQTISLSSDASAIDAGTMDVSFGGRIRSALENLADQGQLVLTFLDGSGNVIGSPVIVSASNTTNRWELVGARVHVPEGARSVTYRFQSTRESGSTDDSYLDAAFLYVLASNIATDIGAEGTGDNSDEDPVDEKIQLEAPDLYVNWTANQSHPILWTTFGNTGDAPVRIDVYQETNGVLNFLANITPSTADTGSYAWIPQNSGLTNGTYYGLKIEISLVGESAIKDTSTETFTVPVTGTTFYINDGSTNGDQFSTAAGNNRNTGLLPSSPLPLITTLFRTYTLGAGDTVYVDTGTYGDFAALELSGNPAVGNGQGVNITGPTSGHTATIDALGFTSPAVIDVNDAQYVTLGNLTLADANYGLWVRSASSNIAVSSLTVTDNLNGGLRIESDSSSNDTLTGIVADNNTGDGIYVGGALVSITNSTSYSNTGDGFDLTDSGAAVLTGDVAYGNAIGLYVANGISGTTTMIGNANLSLGLGNQFYNNANYGIYAQTGAISIAGNTVYGQTKSGGAGIEADYVTTENIVHDNFDGIVSASNSSVTDNLVYNNPDFGLFGGVGTSFTGNVSYSNGVGIRSEIAPNAAGNTSSIDNNLVYDNSVQGIWMTGGRFTSLDNNTVYQPLGDAMLIDAFGGISAEGIQIENNILWAQQGYDISLAPSSESGFKSDYNDLYVTGTGAVGFWETVSQASLAAWQATSGQDPDSLSTNPLFVNTGVDFHEQSLNGSFHGGTLAPILNTSTGLPQANAGVLTSDSNESPALDRGDPTFSYSNEPQPNGGFINLGAYGDTAQASLSPTAYVLVLQPSAGETWIERQNMDITWRSQNTSGTVNIELLQNGTPALAIATGATNSGSYEWIIPTSLTPEGGYTISITLNSAPTATGVSGAFTIDAAVTSFYVNGSATGGIFTSAGGNDVNSGLDPTHPKATIQALLTAYQLGAGDTIFVDEGTYNLTSNIVLTSANSGLTIEGVNTSTSGSGPQTILNRDNTSTISYDIDVQNAANVTIENMTFAGGYYGINAGYNNGSSTYLTVNGCTFFGEQSSGMDLDNNNSTSYIQTGDVIESNVFHVSAAEPTISSIGTQSVANQGNFQVSVPGWGVGSYALEFSAAQQASGNNGGENFEVLVDNTVVATIDPASSAYQEYTTNEFTVGAGTHVIEFLGLDTAGGSNTALVQGLQFIGLPSSTYGLQSNGDQISVLGNTAYGLNYGIYVSNGDGSTISGNTTHNDGTGIAASSCTVTGNISDNNSAIGINVTATTLSGNTTYGNASDGIVIYSGTATGNISYGNPYGLVFEGNATASDNLIYNNTTAGISGGNGSNILGNVLYGNKLGMTIVSYPSAAQGGPVIENNLVYNNATGGIYMVGGDVTPIVNNTIYQPAGIALQLVSYGGGLTANAVSVRDNIIWDTAGTDLQIDPAIETNVTLDYNDLYFTGTGSVGVWGSTPAATLSAWQSISEQDADSISTDPLFVNTGVDFHEQSQNGSYHGGTLAPILNTTTGLPQTNPGTLTVDTNESPAIDRGAPADSYSNEPTPNGGYVNLGAYGDSSQASFSPAHYLFITNPISGLSAATGQTLNVKWRDELTNTGGGAGDTDTIELLTAGNGSIVLTASAPDTGSYGWLLPNSLASGNYQIKVIRNDGTNLSSTSGVFSISAFNGIFYVNGASTGGAFTTAGGNDANSGLDPAHPKATIAAILTSYTMQPGYVIMVDEATYSIPTNLVLTAADSGITIEGVSGKTILNRGNLASGAYVFDIQGATNITLGNLTITGAYYGINASYNENAAGLTVTGCNIYGEEYIGISLQGNNGAATITNNTIDDMLGPNGLYGIETNYTDNLTVAGNTVYGGMGYGIYVAGAVYGAYTQVISNNTVYGSSNGIAAGSGQQDAFTVSNNTIYDNWNVNLSLSGSPITASGNTVYEDGGAGKNESSSEVGVLDASDALITANNVYGNDIGVELSNGILVGNNIHNNSTVGVDSTSTSDTIRGNTIYSNGGWGISGDPATVANNLVYGNTSGGIELGSDYDAQILNNTIYQTSGPAFQLVGLRQNGGNAPSITLNNNVFWDTSAPDILTDDAGELSFTTPTSDYNDLYATGTGEIAQMAGVNFATLSSWQWELGLDTHSISADPQFVNASAANFHVQSSSPTIDAGNPASDFLMEPEPNGGRINLGYDGNTAQAATSPSTSVQVVSPSASQKVQVGQPTTIQWMTSGLLASQTISAVAVGETTAVGEYHAAEYAAFTTSTSSNNNSINTSLVTNPAPQPVYQTYAYAASGVGNYLLYNIPVPNGTYTIRLDWAEPYVNSVGGRTFDIVLNGQTVQSAFDVYAAAGDADSKAVARSFTVTASGGSGISLQLKNDTSTPAFLNAFEVSVANSGGTTNPTVNVQVSLNNGNTWTTIATDQPVDTEGRGSYLWTPAAQTSGYTALVRVVANNAAATTGMSDGPFLIAGPGTAYYVSNSSTTSGNVFTTALGNNANSGTSPNQPMASIEAVLNDYPLGAGDTIYVDNGTYALFHNINIPAADSGVTIEGPAASTGATAILNRANTSIGDYVFSFVSQGTTNVTIENLSITGAYIGINAPYTSGSGTIGVNSITIANNQIYSNFEEGILTGYNTNWTVTGNSIHNNGYYGVYLQGTTATVTNNTVYNEQLDGIFVSNYGNSPNSSVVVSGNTVYGDGTNSTTSAGIYVDNGTISNNTVHDNGYIGIYADQNSLVTGNTVWRQTATNAYGIVVYSAFVTDNVVFGNYDGILAENAGGTIDGNLIYSNTNYGLLIQSLSGINSSNGPFYVATAYSNLIYANSGGGISISGTTADFTLRNNTIYQLVGDAVNLSASNNASYPITIENNILWVQAGYDLDTTTANETGLISNYNILYHTGAQADVGKWNGTTEATLATWQSASSLDSHSSEANPMFVDPAGADAVLGYNATANNGTGYNGGADDNFFVAAGSPAIAAGNATLDPPTDLLGYPYKNPDIGAYAYRGVAADSAPPTIVSVTPSAGQIVVVFSQTPNDVDAQAPSLYTLVGAGTGGSFTASNAIVYTLTPVYQVGTNQVTLIVNGGPLPTDLYQLTIESNSNASVHNLAGVALDGNADGVPGGNYVTTFNLQAVAPTAFSGLQGTAVIAYGTATTTFSGIISAGNQYPPTSETVGVTLNGVTINAPIGANGAFSATFNTSTLPASATPYQVTYSYGGDANFASASNTSTTTLTVEQVTPTITWPTPAGITYGTALSSTQLDASSSVPGTFVYTPAAGTILNAGSGQTLSVTFTPTDSVDYRAVSVSVTINVAKILPAVSLSGTGANPSNATQALNFTATVGGGVPNGETVLLEDTSNGNEVVATGILNSGSATLTVPAGTLLAGTHNLVAVYGGDANYASSQSTTYVQTVQVAVTSVVVNGNLPSLAGVQRSMVDSIVYTFSEPVTLAQSGAFTIAVHSGQIGTVPTLHWSAINSDSNGASTQWVVTFSGAGVVNNSIANGAYDITLNTSAVASEAAPSATVQPRSTDTFYRLFGDINGDGVVNAADNFQLKNALSTYNAAFDYNGDGVINALDNFMFKQSQSISFLGLPKTI